MATQTNKLKIAVIPGDGIGNEVVPEGIRVLEAVGNKFGIDYAWDDKDWSCERFAKTGAMMPEDGLAQIAKHDAIFLGAVGFPGVPDHISLWGLLIPIRRGFHQYVNLRPVRLFHGLKSPLADRKPGDIDYYIVRENNEGEYSAVGGRNGAGGAGRHVHQEGLRPRDALRLQPRHVAQEEGGRLRHQVQRHLHFDALLG
jgi:tartrate dehydrogenase/decarboxylase/D-malate dehydrogenase